MPVSGTRRVVHVPLALFLMLLVSERARGTPADNHGRLSEARLPERAAAAPREAHRLSRSGISVVGNADPAAMAKLLDSASDARAALAVLAPRTATVTYPLTFLVDCSGASTTRPGAHAQKWGLYVFLRCAPALDARQANEHFARLLLQHAARGLPLWLEVGTARLVARAERGSDGRLRIGQHDADDIASYRARPLPARDVFSTTPASPQWSDASRREPFARQSWLYARDLASAGALSACLAWPAETRDPDAQLRACLGQDTDVFHSRALERWIEGVTTMALERDAPSDAATTNRIPDEILHAALADGLLASADPTDAQRLARRTGLERSTAPETLALGARLKLLAGELPGATLAFDRVLESRFDPLIAYHLASALMAPAIREDSLSAVSADSASRAEIVLNRVVEIFPLADALALLGIARLRSGDVGGAVQGLSDAVAAWPRHEYALWMARALAAGKRTAAARATARPLTEIGDSDTIRRRARDFVSQLPDGDGDAGPLPILPPLRPGERRTTGRLQDIECQSDWTWFSVQRDDHTIVRFATARLGLTTFTVFGAMPAPVRCGRRSAPERVVAVWKEDERMPPGSAGIVLSVAFLPGGPSTP
ncbi:MAG TPA: hypothetical protein VMF13_04655 [Luteitalea sp.]|nr:hypothetical protein [Luteitalea sp.]